MFQLAGTEADFRQNQFLCYQLFTLFARQIILEIVHVILFRDNFQIPTTCFLFFQHTTVTDYIASPSQDTFHKHSDVYIRFSRISKTLSLFSVATLTWLLASSLFSVLKVSSEIPCRFISTLCLAPWTPASIHRTATCIGGRSTKNNCLKDSLNF